MQKRKGRWKPGESGNPAGRPPGAFSHKSIRSIVGEERFTVSGCEEVRNSGFLDALSPMPHEV
jgi:hypothetical protein